MVLIQPGRPTILGKLSAEGAANLSDLALVGHTSTLLSRRVSSDADASPVLSDSAAGGVEYEDTNPNHQGSCPMTPTPLPGTRV